MKREPFWCWAIPLSLGALPRSFGGQQSDALPYPKQLSLEGSTSTKKQKLGINAFQRSIAMALHEAGSFATKCLVVVAALFVQSPCRAEIITDGSLGAGLNLPGPGFVIPADLGQQRGGNLFHSFSQFNLLMGESATFTGPGDVTNVLARVTGGQASSIDGRINSTIAGANLFLINPKGIVFGKNARLNVSGSFVASSADYVTLGEQGRFDATNSADDILTSAPPGAFGFLGPAPATITVRGSTLIAKPGANLGFIGGDLILRDGALVAAPGGTVQLASVRSAGVLGLNINDRSATPDTSAFATLGSIGALGALDGSSLTIIQGGSAGAGGRVVIRGGRLVASSTFITFFVTFRGN